MTPDLMDLAIEGLKKTLTSVIYTLEKYTFSDLTGKIFNFAVVQ